MPEFLRPDDVARRLGVPVVTVRRWVRNGVMPGTRIGGVVLIPISAVDALTASAGPLDGGAR